MAEIDDKAFARLRIQSQSIDAAEITRRLGAEPSYRHALGDLMSRHADLRYESHEWRFDSLKLVDSQDGASHIDWMLAFLERLSPEIKRLQNDGATVDLHAFWGECGTFRDWQEVGRQNRRALSAEQQQRVDALDLDGYGEEYNLSVE
jgi:hypothetical protein